MYVCTRLDEHESLAVLADRELLERLGAHPQHMEVGSRKGARCLFTPQHHILRTPALTRAQLPAFEARRAGSDDVQALRRQPLGRHKDGRVHGEGDLNQEGLHATARPFEHTLYTRTRESRPYLTVSRREGGLVLPWVHACVYALVCVCVMGYGGRLGAAVGAPLVLPLVPVSGAVCVPFACVFGKGGFG